MADTGTQVLVAMVKILIAVIHIVYTTCTSIIELFTQVKGSRLDAPSQAMKKKSLGKSLVENRLTRFLQVIQTNQKGKTSIGDLPPELILQVFRRLEYEDELASIACLGVTCSRFYALMKKVHPAPIPLSLPARCKPHKRRKKYLILENLLKEFIGPKYRLSRVQYIYFNREIYGELSETSDKLVTEKENSWVRRYLDYLKLSFDKRTANGVVKMYYLPGPFGLGEEWYTICKKIFREQGHLERFCEELGEPLRVVQRKIYATRIWESYQNEVALDIFEDWVEMMDL